MSRIWFLILWLGLGFASAQSTDFRLEDGWRLLPQSATWRAADQVYLIAAQSLNVARGAAGLSLSAGLDTSRTQLSSSNPALNSTILSGSLNVQFGLAVLPWSPAFDAVRTAERNLEKARLDLLETRSGLQLQFLGLYAQGQLATLDAQNALENSRLATERVRVVKAQLGNGTASQEALLSAEAAARSAQAMLNSAVQLKDFLQRSVFTALGLPPQAVQNITLGSLLSPPKLVGNPDLKTRSDVRRAMLAVLEAQDNLQNAQRDRLMPNLTVSSSLGGVGADGKPTGTQAGASLNLGSGVLGVNGSYTPNAPSNNATVLTVSLQLSVPILAPASDGRIGAAEAALNASKLNLTAIQAGAALDVQNKRLEFENQNAMQGVSNANFEVAKRRLEDSQARLAAGLASSLEVLTAQVQQLLAAREVLNSSLQTALAGYRLAAAIKPLELVK